MKRVTLVMIRGYQKLISPMFGSNCRFYPSCSQYGYEAIETHGVIKGGAMTAWRIARCNPFNAGGFDPVPGRHDHDHSHEHPTEEHSETVSQTRS